jgi:hypothetical protein
MDAPLPFDVADHITTIRVRLAPGVDLVLLVAELGGTVELDPVGGMVGALWCIRGQWGDAAIGRA